MRNEEIRSLLRLKDIRQWQLAKMLGVSEYTLCRKLREELPEDEKRRIISVIQEGGEED